MEYKNDTSPFLGEQTCLASEAYQTKLDADKTTLAIAAEGYHTVLAVQPQSVPVETVATAEEDQELYRIGDYIGERYEVLAIHRGAWGVIYGTYDHQTELPRALKTIQKRYQFDKKLLDLFREEAALWVSLEKHPYIVRAYSVEKYEDLPFVLTEYISNPQGNDLRSWLGSSKLTLAIGAEMALKIAQGMQYAHSKVTGLVHRDLKPANILVDEYAQPYITDFGLVHAVGSDAGTPAYMAPEQWRKEAVTIQSDIYAFGCILYEILTGHRMYPAVAVDEWRYMHLMQIPVSPNQLKPEIPAGLEEFVLKCLEKDPDRRPRDWDEIVEVLAGWCYQLTGVPPILDFGAYKLDAKELLSASISLINLSKYPEALAVCERIFEIDPQLINAWNMKGLILCNLNRSQEALDWLDSCPDQEDYLLLIVKGRNLSQLERYEEALALHDFILETRPNNTIALEDKGFALKKLKRYREALDCYDKILAIEPDNEGVFWEKTKILENLGEYEEALIWCRKYEEAKPRDYDGWFEQGVILTKLNRFEEALDCFSSTLAINPDYSLCWFDKGITLHNMKRYDEAVECFDKAITLQPDKCEAWIEKADSLDELERYREAVDCLDRALELNPENEKIWYKRGLVLFRLGKYKEVISDCNRALDINQHYVGAWVCKLRALEKLDDLEQVLPHYDRALELCPDGWELWAEKGRVLNRLKRYQEALPCFNRALEISPEEYFSWVRKGESFFHLKQREEALFCFSKALELNPQDKEERVILFYYKGQILDKFGRYDEAVEAFEQAVKSDPKRAPCFSGKARSLYHLEKYEEAVACCDRALAIEPEETWALEYKGKCLIMLGHTMEGTACLKKLLELDPELDIWDDFSEKIDV